MLEDGCTKQKHLHVLGLSLQNLLGQIVQDVALIPTDLLQEGSRIGLLWQGKAKQLQADEPALGACGHLLDGLLWHLDAHHLTEESLDLLCCTAQLVRAHFQHVLACSLHRQWQGRVSPCGDDDAQLRRQMFNQIRQGGMHLLFRDHLIVIENQHKVIRALSQQIDQGRQQGLEGRWGLRLQVHEERLKAFGALHLQCGEDIGPEKAGFIVLLVQGDPAESSVAGLQRLCPGRK